MKKITLLFYATVFLIFASMAFARLVREPYPSLNMPTFTRSGIENEIVQSSYFEIAYFNDGQEVWRGDLRTIFDKVPINLYRNNMRFIFFNNAGKNEQASIDQKMKILSAIPGGMLIYNELKKWTDNDVIGGAETVVPELMLRRKPFEESTTDFIVNEYVEYYHLSKGFQSREIIRERSFTFGR